MRALLVVLAWVLIIAGVTAAGANQSPTPSQSPTHEPVPPALPAFIRSVHGPVRVILKPNLYLDGDSLYGAWYPHIRTIFIRDSLPPWFARAVLEHEVCHVAMSDFGVALDEAVEERVCDAIAQQRSIEALMR
jgi:hypothetical protein